jgi:hypothetical protein
VEEPVTITIPAVLFLLAAIFATAAAFGISTGTRTRIPNVGWLAVASVGLALFIGAI